MGQNFLRAVEITLGGKSGTTIASRGSKGLRIKGAVRQWALQAPNMLSARVYNPSPSTVAAFLKAEFADVTVSAGYERGTFGPIFQGQIKQAVAGHETAVDTFLDIFAADGQNFYEQARVGSSLAAGHTPKDRVDLALRAGAPFGIAAALGTVNVDLSKPAAPRGAAFVGAARDILRMVALSAGATWSVQDGSVHIVDARKPVPGSAVKLSPSTGLVGWPQQTIDGLQVTSFINPSLRPHVNIQLDPSQIQLAQQNINSFDTGASATNQTLADQNILAGTYNIFHLDRFFDTRGSEFYDVSLCIGQGGKTPAAQAGQGYYTLGGS